jgi:nucleoside-diphosphate-sugar epimerase
MDERQGEAVKTLVAGGTGAVGRPLTRLLIEAGHEVVAITRSADNAARLGEFGATPLVGSVLDLDWLGNAVRDAAPEVVIDQLTDLPQRVRPRGLRAFYRRQIPLRTQGSGALLDAARRSGARRMVSQSVAFIYAPDGGGLKVESDRIWRDAPAPFGAALAGAADHDQRLIETPDLDGIVLRYGVFYGPGTLFALGNGIYEDVRRRRFPMVGAGESRWSFCHVQDAAAAAVNALDHGERGVYNVVDDEPAFVRDWLPIFAESIEAPPPRSVPAWLSRLVAGPALTAWGTSFPGTANDKAKGDLGWSPQYASWRQGFREAKSW